MELSVLYRISKKDLRKEGSLYRTFVYGSKEEKLEGINWMMTHPSWSMKTWATGLLYDKDFEVRGAAAAWIMSTELLTGKKELESACAIEQNTETKAIMQKAVEHIQSLYK